MSAQHQVLRQSSVYGVAQAVRKSPESCFRLLDTIVPTLVACINSPHAKEEDYEGTTENAIFALGIICNSSAYRQAGRVAWGGVDAQMVAGVWLQGLPLRADELEAKIAHSQLCDGIERGDELIIGESYRNLSILLRIIAEILLEISPEVGWSAGCQLANASTLERMQNIVKQFLGSPGGLPVEFVQASLAPLTVEQQQVLKLAL